MTSLTRLLAVCTLMSASLKAWSFIQVQPDGDSVMLFAQSPQGSSELEYLSLFPSFQGNDVLITLGFPVYVWMSDTSKGHYTGEGIAGSLSRALPGL